MDPHAHWEAVFQHQAPDQVSWFQAEPTLSLELIRRSAPDPGVAILDVGAGASRLVDRLLAAGYRNISVLDISGTALKASRHRLGPSGTGVGWIEADARTAPLAPASVDVWHDRAVFHFLTRAEDRRAYLTQVRRVTRAGGHVLVATFAADGPSRCSGLEVA